MKDCVAFLLVFVAIFSQSCLASTNSTTNSTGTFIDVAWSYNDTVNTTRPDITAFVGDVLVFQWNVSTGIDASLNLTSRTVELFANESSFDNCSFEGANVLANASAEGYIAYNLSTNGTFYFGSSIGDDCSNGQLKLRVIVANKVVNETTPEPTSNVTCIPLPANELCIFKLQSNVIQGIVPSSACSTANSVADKKAFKTLETFCDQSLLIDGIECQKAYFDYQCASSCTPCGNQPIPCKSVCDRLKTSCKFAFGYPDCAPFFNFTCKSDNLKCSSFEADVDKVSQLNGANPFSGFGSILFCLLFILVGIIF